jgi:phospholipid transport system substrate-binding protein
MTACRNPNLQLRGELTRRQLLAVVVLSAATTAPGAMPSACAEAPRGVSATDDLHASVEGVLHVLRDPRLAGSDKKGDRQAALRKVMERTIDFPDAARRALAVHWAARTPAERDEFIGLFRELVLASYAAQLDGYRVDRVIFVSEVADDDAVTVHTRVEAAQRAPVAIDYRLHRRNARWLVYDVLVEGVSLVANYRAQFNSVIRTKSYSELIRRMKAQVEG